MTQPKTAPRRGQAVTVPLEVVQEIATTDTLTEYVAVLDKLDPSVLKSLDVSEKES